MEIHSSECCYFTRFWNSHSNCLSTRENSKVQPVAFWFDEFCKNLVFTDLEIQNTTSSLLRSKEFVLDNFKDEPNTKSWKNLTFLFISLFFIDIGFLSFFRLAYSKKNWTNQIQVDSNISSCIDPDFIELSLFGCFSEV